MRPSPTNTRFLRCLNLIASLQFLQFSTNAFSAENVVSIPAPARPTNSVPGIRIRPGFRAELVATESVVSAPAALAFDENSRLFVAEMRDYPNRRDQSPHLGRIRLLEDADGDGVFEASTVYADNLPLPSAIACYDGGVFVAATPDIIYLKDVNGDGVADERRVVFTGFGSDSATIGSDHLINSFTWGLDNRIHGANAGIGGSITANEGNTSEPIALRRNDFSFDPRTLAFSPEAGSAQSGLTFDNRGRKFFSDFTHPLRQPLLEPEDFARNPYFIPAQDAVDIDSPSALLFRLTSVATSTAPDRPSTPSAIQSTTLFTRARGCVIYRGNAFPSNFVGNAFIADSDAHCIHRVLLRDNGVVTTANRPPDEPGTEFLLSSDPAFRPVQIVNSPDGALYIADFRDGNDSGQILRIVPDNFKQPKAPQLASAKTYDLAAALAHPNGWHRDTAARLLCQKKEPATIGLLTNMVNNSRNPLARLHALSILNPLTGLTEPVLLKGLRDSDPPVRECSLLLSRKLAADGIVTEPLWDQFRFMADDNAPRVRYQLAVTLGHIRHQGRPQLLAHLLQRAGPDVFLQNAVFSSLAEGSGECFVALASDNSTRNNPAGLDLLRRLAVMVGTQGSLDEVNLVVDWLARNGTDHRQANTYILAAGLGEGLRRTGSSLALVDSKHRLEPLYSYAVSISPDYRISEPLRLEAIRLLGVSAYPLSDVGDWFLLLLDSNQSPAIRSAAISTLSAYSDPRIVTSLMARWPSLTPILRKQVVAGFLSRSERVDTVVSAIETGRISPDDVNALDANLLRAHPDQSIRQRALRIFGPLTPQHPALLETFRPALRLLGNANTGRELYQARCATCHPVGEFGRAMGPDLADMRALGKEKLLSAIVQPGAEAQTKNASYLIETKNGQLRAGLLHQQTSRSVTLITPANDEIVIPRVNIQYMQPQPWSLMPDALEHGLSPQAMADLLQYILTPIR